jgi:hypothetical protein
MWYCSGIATKRCSIAPSLRRAAHAERARRLRRPGPHYCLGAHLARREITVMFRELFERLPDLQIEGAPDRLFSFFIHGIKHMRCTFTPGRPTRRAGPFCLITAPLPA